MGSHIELLKEEVINQIAAGEVIENPASVVKEIIENAIDASASSIIIRIKRGGMDLISSEDDGIGIAKEDLPLAIQRHATSKIKDMNDLNEVKTLGFRGEALSSISAISNMKVETATGKEAFLIEVEAGEILSFTKTSRRRGTTITIKNLFFNIPVRKKFQKSSRSQVAQIHRLLTFFALSHPQISFTLISENETLLEVWQDPNDSFEEALKKRVKNIWMPSLIEKSIFVSAKEEALRIVGYLADPIDAKQNRQGQYLFINQRSIRSYSIESSIKMAYGTRIKEGMHPSFVLHFFIPPSFIDVNVHPRKTEVRFKEESFLKKLIKEMLFSSFVHPKTITVPSLSNLSFTPTIREEKSLEEIFSFLPPNEQFHFSMTSKEVKKTSLLFLINQFAIVQTFFDQGSFAILDLRRAYARCIFENLISETKGVDFTLQTLLVPYIIEMEEEKIFLIEEKKELFQRLGFEIRRIGKKSLAIDAILSFIEKEEIDSIFSFILEEMGSIKNRADLDHHRLAKFSIQIANVKKRDYSKFEAELILEKLFNLDDYYFDPLGRHIWVRLTSNEIEFLFKKGEIKCKINS